MENDERVIPTVGVVLFDSEGRTLLVENLQGSTHLTGVFGLASGRVDDGEESMDAAVRELKEESGLRATKDSLYFVKQYYAEISRKDGVKKMSWDVYLCSDYSGELAPCDETRPLWVSPGELDKIENILPNVKDAISKAYAEGAKLRLWSDEFSMGMGESLR